MGWIYLLGEKLDSMNADRLRHDRVPLTWAHVESLTGIHERLLRNLENNSELKATNTRFLDSLCRFFACGADELVKMVPDRPRQPDYDLIDRFLGGGFEDGRQPDCHVDVLYGEAAQAWWRENRDRYRPSIRRR